jgi:hypothetical protein
MANIFYKSKCIACGLSTDIIGELIAKNNSFSQNKIKVVVILTGQSVLKWRRSKNTF